MDYLGTLPPGEGLLWPEQVAALADIDTRSVTFYTSQRARRERKGEPLTGWDIPAPVGERVLREVPTQAGQMVSVWSPRYAEAEIRAWVEVRAKGRRPESTPRARDEAGRYAAKAGR